VVSPAEMESSRLINVLKSNIGSRFMNEKRAAVKGKYQLKQLLISLLYGSQGIK